MYRNCLLKYLCILLFLSWNCYAVNNNFYRNDKSKQQQKYLSKKREINNLLDKCAEFIYKPESYKIDLDSAKFNLDKAFKLSKKIKNQDLLYRCIFCSGEILFEKSAYTKATERILKVIAYYQKTKQLQAEAELWSFLGNKYFWKSPRNSQSFQESFKYYKKH